MKLKAPKWNLHVVKQAKKKSKKKKVVKLWNFQKTISVQNVERLLVEADVLTVAKEKGDIRYD